MLDEVYTAFDALSANFEVYKVCARNLNT